MKIATMAFLSLFCASAFSAQVKLDMVLKHNQKFSQPQIIANLDETASVSVGSTHPEETAYEIEVLSKQPTELKNTYRLNFAVYEVSNNEKRLISSPDITVKEGKTANISVMTDSDKMDLFVTPTKIIN